MNEFDEVDRLLAAWQVEAPNLDTSPMAVLSRVSRLARHLDRMRRASFAKYQIESWEFDVLTALRRSGEPYELSPGQLLKQTMVTSGTMTNRIDRLAQRGFVVRARDTQDGRSVRVRLTEPGRECAENALADLMAAEKVILRRLNPQAQQTLAALLREVNLEFEADSAQRR